MGLEAYLFHSLTEEYHQDYVQARTKQGADCIADYDNWLAKHKELEQLKKQNQADTWERSEHNPVNYPDFDSLDDDTKEQRITQGKQDYWADSEALETKISQLRHLLLNPELEKSKPVE